MQEQFAQAINLLNIVWKRRWQSLLIATIVSILGWTVVFSLPDKYEALTRVYLNNETILTPLLRGLAVDSNVTEATASMMRRTLLSRPNLEKVIKETDLNLLVESDKDFDHLLDGITQKIKISAGGDHNEIYSITYEDSDPERAASVVKKLLDIFIDEVLVAGRRDTDITDRFLDEQIHEYENRLVKAEEELKEFKRKHIGVMPTQGRTYFERLQMAKDELGQSELDLDEAMNKKNELQRQISAVENSLQNSPSSISTALTAPIDSRIQALESKLDELLLNYTEDHPDVISTRRVIAELRDQRETELASLKSGGGKARLEEHPAYSDLVVELGKAQGNVAALQVRVKEYRKRVNELNELIDTIPKVEAELAKLNRDYEINKRNYEELVSRRESANISHSAEKNTDELQFKVIEPPRIPLLPVGPNRIKGSAAVFLVAISAGIFYAWLISQLKPTFNSVQSLREKYELPVLGGVSLVATVGKNNRMSSEIIYFGSSFLALFIGFASVVYWHLTH